MIFISVSLTCNTGIAGINLQKLSVIGTYVTNAGIPFVIARDWNVLPSELLESSWPARIKDKILLPCDLEISCTSARPIDKAVCHRSLVNIARLQSFVAGPWKTHQALLLTLPRSPRRFLTRSLTTSPTKLPPIDRNSGFRTSWSESVNLSESSHFRHSDRSHPGYLDLTLSCPRRAGTGTQTLVVLPKLSCCRNVERKHLNGEDISEEGLRLLFNSNLLSSASLQERNISLIKSVGSGPGCFLV